MRGTRCIARVLVAALALVFASACRSNAPPDDASTSDAETPAACMGCPRDCCRINDAGFACMNWSTRNANTFECHCGSGPACEQPVVCCPPDNQPQAQLPPVCLPNPSACDPRPSPGS